MLKILRIQDDRNLAGKSTIFRFKGQRVKKETLKRGRKRYNGTGELPEWHKLQPPVCTFNPHIFAGVITRVNLEKLSKTY
jgi:hypothetical protein